MELPGPRQPRDDGPALDASPEAITVAADDFGHLTHLVPAAVCRPGSAAEVVQIVRYAMSAGLAIRARGAGHSVAGQAQCDGGIICDLARLDLVGPVERDRVSACAGARWSSVLSAALQQGLTPPVLTDYLGLSVGGTLAAGGIGGASHQHGPQVDHVRELEIVTPDGQIVTCSPTRSRDLFFAALGGQGRYGIITRATIPLVPAPERARVFKIHVPSLVTFIACQRRLARERRFGYLEGQIIAGETGGWDYMLELAAFYSGNAPDDKALLDGLRLSPAAVRVDVEDAGYEEFCQRMLPGVRLLAATGDWYRPHPWLSVFLPADVAGEFVADTLASLSPASVGPLPMLLYPLRRGPIQAPQLSTPSADEDGLFYSFSILRTVPATAQAIAAAVESNKERAQIAVAAGGTLYSISAVGPEARTCTTA
jgi:FAD/FMN-containing dehydrogenase